MLAEKVGKEHKNVLRDVQTLGCSEGFRRLNFEPANYPDAQGKPRPMIWITEDGHRLCNSPAFIDLLYQLCRRKTLYASLKDKDGELPPA